MTKTRFLVLVTALALLLAIPTSVFAQRVPPNIFLGAVTLDGAPAVDGAAVTAWIDGQQVAATNASGGKYSLLVDQRGSFFAGKTISFKVSGAIATETSAWMQGGADVLNLTGVSGSSGGGGGTGAAGSTGPRGATGATGVTGPVGPAGPAGPGGSDGPAGSSGSTGSAGSAGPAGPAGADRDYGGGALGLIAFFVAILALMFAGGSYIIARPRKAA